MNNKVFASLSLSYKQRKEDGSAINTRPPRLPMKGGQRCADSLSGLIDSIGEVTS